MPTRFLCGCYHENYIPENAATFDSVVKDDEGYLVCKIHNEREYGWRSPMVDHPAGHRAPIHQKQYTKAELEMSPSTAEDKRFNFDPAEFYFKVCNDEKREASITLHPKWKPGTKREQLSLF